MSQVFHRFTEDLLAVTEKYGPGSVAGLISPNVTNEAAYLFQKFFRTVLKSNSIIGTAGPEVPWDPLSVNLNAVKLLTITPPSMSLSQAHIILLFLGSNGIVPGAVRDHILAARNSHDARVAVFSSERVSLDFPVEISIVAPPRGISELVRAIHWLVHFQGGTDGEIIWRNRSLYNTALKNIKRYDAAVVADRWGVTGDQMQKIAFWLSRKRKVSLVFSGSGTYDPQILRNYRDVLNLILATGHLGAEGMGIHYLSRTRNELGLPLMGCSPSYLPGFVPLSNESAREWFSQNWQVPISEEPGVSINQLSDRILGGGIKALVWLGQNPFSTLPAHLQWNRCIPHLELMAGAGCRRDPRCRYWWPLAPWEDMSGSIITADRLILRKHDVTSADSGHQDWQLVGEWLHSASPKEPVVSTAGQVIKEMSETLPAMLGVAPEKLDQEPFFWQTISRDMDALLDPEFEVTEIPNVSFQPVPEWTGEVDAAEGFHVALRPVVCQDLPEEIQQRLSRSVTATIGLHPDDAAELNVQDATLVRVAADGLSMTAACMITPRTPRGTILVMITEHAPAFPLLNTGESFLRVQLTPV